MHSLTHSLMHSLLVIHSLTHSSSQSVNQPRRCHGRGVVLTPDSGIEQLQFILFKDVGFREISQEFLCGSLKLLLEQNREDEIELALLCVKTHNEDVNSREQAFRTLNRTPDLIAPEKLRHM